MSLLFNDGTSWQKKTGTFDATMERYDGAETCELVSLYMLHKLSKIIPKDQIGLYRDDGLAMKPNSNGPQLDKLRKKIIEIYKSEGLKVTCDTNLVETDFLDACYNIKSSKYFPYRKPNDNPQYINTSSNHPPQVIKQIPKIISQRLSKLSCDKSEFEKAVPDYETALSASGYQEKLQYQDKNESNSKIKGRESVKSYGIIHLIIKM